MIIGCDVLIKIDSVSKRFGDFYAVNNISLDIEKGEFLGLLGPNGAGKTTLIKMLIGLLKPTTGIIYIVRRRPRIRSRGAPGP